MHYLLKEKMIGERNINKLYKQLEIIKKDGVLNGDDADRKENLHRLFMYPAMMVPATQSAIIEAFSQELPNSVIAIDPFMGSGTALLSCMEFGFDVYGQDINPFAVLLSQAKTTDYNIAQLYDSYERVKKHIENDVNTSVEIFFDTIDKWFTKDAQLCFSKIRRAIVNEPDSNIRKFLWVLMSESVRVGSNDRTSTFKLHKRSQEELGRRHVNIIKNFFDLVQQGISDLKFFQDKIYKKDCRYGNATINWGNTRLKINSQQKFDLLVSSPPYGDNHTTVTYGQTSYLPLQWIDPKDIDCPYDYLKTTQEIDRQSLGGSINRKALLEQKSRLFEKSKSFEAFYQSIPEQNRERYNKTISFIADFDESLDSIVSVMDKEAFYIWTIGNRSVGGREVPNAQILIDLMQYRGFELFFRADRLISNKIQPKKNNFSKTMDKEDILIFH